MKRFILEKNYADFLNSMGMKTDEILKKAHLPDDLFRRKAPCVTAEEYYRFTEAIGALCENGQTPVLLATAENIETFSPPIFAAFCSENAEKCIKRLAQYKALVGALVYDVTERGDDISLEIKPHNSAVEIPETLIGIEFVFLVNLIRKATRVEIVPKSVTAKIPMTNKAYESYLQTPITTGSANRIVFNKSDAQIPFISRSVNNAIRKKLAQLFQKRLIIINAPDPRIHIINSISKLFDNSCQSRFSTSDRSSYCN